MKYLIILLHEPSHKYWTLSNAQSWYAQQR